jgi:peroxiredoxin
MSHNACSTTDGISPVTPIPHVSLQRLPRSPGQWLRAGILLVALAGLVLSIAARASAGAQTVNQLVGRPAPAFTLSAELRGQLQPTHFSLADQHGHPVLLVFFYTLCPQCLGQLQTVRDVTSAHAASGLAPLYIDSPAELPAIPYAYVIRDQIDAPVLLDSGGAVATAYGIRYYPTLVLVDGSGTVRATWTGTTSAAELDQGIRRLTG